jgi:inhibitor of KinA sporulation pathway (predicted exonuclease)
MSEIYTSLDLEMDQPSNRIISIGYCIGNIYTEEVLSRGDIYIKSPVKLNPEIIKLTGITDNTLETIGHDSVLDGYRILAAEHLKYNSFINPVTWGGGDSQLLFEQSQLPDGEKWCFGRRHLDVKTIFITRQLARKLKPYSGLARSMTKVGLAFQGKKHKSEDDAYNTFRMFCFLIKELAPKI